MPRAMLRYAKGNQPCLGISRAGTRLNPERFLERPWQNSPAKRTTYGAPQNIQKPLECAKNACVRHLRKVGYAAQVLKSDICTTPAQFRVVSLVWVYSGCIRDLREWVPEVEVININGSCNRLGNGHFREARLQGVHLRMRNPRQCTQPSQVACLGCRGGQTFS